MGALDQFAKQLWSEEAEIVTEHTVSFEAAVEITITHVQLDGLITPIDKNQLQVIAAPWNMAAPFDSIVVDFKMPGDHVDLKALLLLEQRRANWVAELIKQKQPEKAQNVACWMVHCRLPAELEPKTQMLAPGIYELDNSLGKSIFIAANELPLRKELIPFLVARDGIPLVEFGHWVIRNKHRSVQWIVTMLRSLTMTEEQRMELLRRLPADELKELITLQMRNTSQILRFLEANDPNAAKQILQELSVDQRLEGLDPKQIVANLPTEARLEGLDPKQIAAKLPTEARLQGLAAKERLEGLDPKQIAATLPTEARLEGLDPKQIAANLPAEVRLEGIDATQRVKGLAPEQRLVGLDAAHALLAMPNEVLRGLSVEYVASLPDDVQARIRERLG